MSSPIFKNEKPYSVFVPTPYGSSTNVSPGKFISGTFFIPFYKSNRELKLMPVGTVVPVNMLVCSYDVKEKVTAPEAVAVVVPPLRENITEPEKVAEHISEPLKNKGGRPRKSTEQAVQDMWKNVSYVLPSASEVDRMTTEDLQKLAGKVGVSKALPRQELVENIKFKLG